MREASHTTTFLQTDIHADLHEIPESGMALGSFRLGQRRQSRQPVGIPHPGRARRRLILRKEDCVDPVPDPGRRGQQSFRSKALPCFVGVFPKRAMGRLCRYQELLSSRVHDQKVER